MDLKFTKATDSQHQEKLTSYFIYSAWRSGAVHIGQPATFEVLTAFVGDGAQIKINGKSAKGKKLGKIKDTIKNNKYIGEFELPDKIQIGDQVSFEVELPDNGLKDVSEEVTVLPPIEISNMKWSAKEARREDVLTLSADIKGLYNGTEVKLTIYEFDLDGIHDRIAELPATVQNDKIEVKWEYEYHEDTDEIPTTQELQKYGRNYNPPEYFFTIKAGELEYGKNQESGLLLFKDWIEVKLVNYTGKESYVLHLPDGTTRPGQFNQDGTMREDKIPPGPYYVEVKKAK